MRFTDNPVLWLVVAFLAVWRITNIVQKEEIASPVRKLAGVVEPDGEDPDYWIYPDNFLGKLLYCFLCMSVWVGLLSTIVLYFFPPALLPFALSAAAIAFKAWMEKPSIQYNENYYLEEDDLEQHDSLEDDDALDNA